MNKGYICLAQNTRDVNYLRQAYALALSLKTSQTSVDKLSVCVDDNTKRQITNKHIDIFDNIIDIPWGDSAEKEQAWKIQNKWKFYYMSPYDETVILDSDMLFPTDVSFWWDILSQQDVWATTNVKTFRGETATGNYYRKVFTANNLPNVYMAYFYFKKSTLASELFAMIEIIFQHWERMYYKYLPKGKPDWLSGDVAFALAMQILGIEDKCTRNNVDAPTLVHMKSHIQNITEVNIHDKWTESLPTYYVDNKNFKVGNFQQTLPFHYIEDDWLTDSMIKKMEEII